MNRRSFLRAAAAGGLAASTGCLGVLSGDPNPNVALGKPDTGDLTIEQYRGHRYPVWGERVPDVTVPAVDGGEVAFRTWSGRGWRRFSSRVAPRSVRCSSPRS